MAKFGVKTIKMKKVPLFVFVYLYNVTSLATLIITYNTIIKKFLLFNRNSQILISCGISKSRAKSPRNDHGLPFSLWSLRVLAGFVSKEVNLVDSISHAEIRNIILKHGIKWRQSKIPWGLA